MLSQRESDTLASLSQNLQSLRTSSTQHTQTITRLEACNADLDRQLALDVAQERAARATLRSAETRNKALREEITRLKGSVVQIRAQCATDIRRRDGEIQRLKRHLEGRRGRDGNGGQVGVVVVTPGVSKSQAGNRHGEVETDLESPAYSLKQETTEFLTQLSQGLSDENDALISLVRGTLATLRSLQGLQEGGQGAGSGNMPEGIEDAHGLMGGPPSFEALAANTDEVLEHLRDLLTNPSFVPLEEVELREDEIHRLREGWEKMAGRWREAVALMDGWKKRMVDTGDTINLDDLKIGMELGTEIPTVQGVKTDLDSKPVDEVDANELDVLQDLQDDSADSSGYHTDRISAVDFDTHAADRALSAIDANVRHTPSPRKDTHKATDEENTKDFVEDDLSLLDFSTFKAPVAKPSKVMPDGPFHVSTMDRPAHLDTNAIEGT